jgi:hypothetical protein
VAQAEVLAQAASGFDDTYAEHETALIDAAKGKEVDELQRLCRTWRDHHDDEKARDDAEHRYEQRGLTMQFGFDGSCKGNFSLDPVAAELVNAALDTEPDPAGSVDRPRTLRQRRADKLTDICHQSLHDADCTCVNDSDRAGADPTPDAADPESPASSDPGPPAEPRSPCRAGRGGSRATVNVIVDIRTLVGDDVDDLDQLRSELARGGPITGPSLDRVLCDASFRALITNGPRAILAMNRATPDISPGLREAIRIRDRHCQFTGCDRHHTWCDIHHLTPRHRGGPTNHDNLILLCRHHHGLVHDGGWTLARAPDGTVTVCSP